MSKIYETITPDDERLIWSGAISVQRGQGWVQPWRLPYDDLALYPPDVLREKAAMPAGVRLRFATDASAMIVVTEPMATAGNMDLFADDCLIATTAFHAGDMTHLFLLPGGGMRTLELWLHQTTPFRLRGIRLSEGATIERAPNRLPKWIAYGSSITHCAAAVSPAFTWPGVVARTVGLDLTCLGYAGQCHADPMIARMIRDLPADFVSVKLGINIQGHGSMNTRTFLPAVIGTLATIRDGHPDVPFVVCSPICSPPRESTPNAVGMTLEMMREEVATAVAIFRERGDENIYYVNGLDLFGPEMKDSLPDELHPNGEGYVQLGQNFIHDVFNRIGIDLPVEAAVG